MSESQSFVETTLPPGYAAIETVLAPRLADIGIPGGMRGKSLWTWRSVDRMSFCEFRSISECYRSAWRHWTAAVLRGRDVRWCNVLSGYGEIYDGRCASLIISPHGLSKHVEWSKIASEWEVFEGSYRLGMPTRDPDEAMARFAALVLATEGMVAR
jgi:hypothetical protein